MTQPYHLLLTDVFISLSLQFGNKDSTARIVIQLGAGWISKELWFHSPQGKKIFSFAKHSSQLSS